MNSPQQILKEVAAEEKAKAVVRNRKTYAYFQRVAKHLQGRGFRGKDLAEMLKFVYTQIDDWHGFGTQTLADYAWGSLTLLLEDLGLASAGEPISKKL